MREVYLDNMPWEQALDKFLTLLKKNKVLEPGPAEIISVTDALSRVTAEPVFAGISYPHYHAAAMDGVAVQAANTFGVSETAPKYLRWGEEAIPVDTGDPLPEGCDAVIMIEELNFVQDNSQEETVEIIAPAAPWQHVRTIGEDVVATEMILPANHRLRPYDLGGLLNGGISQIAVHSIPRVAILPTGSELVDPGTIPKTGRIIESNSWMIAGLVQEWGADPIRMDTVKDDYELLKEAILNALVDTDILAISAGSSAGSEDYTASLVSELGEVLVHGVATKPGKPVILGIIQNKPVIGVPGYPVSAALACELFLMPVISVKLGLVPTVRPEIEAVVSRKIVSPLGMEEFVRVKLGKVGEKMIATTLPRGAGVLTSLIEADGILRVPRLSEGLPAGAKVKVELLKEKETIGNTTVVIGSHDLSLDILANHLQRLYPERSLSSSHVGSLGGLLALQRGEAHLAGTHLLDESTGEYNISYLKRFLNGQKVVLVNLVYRQQGLVVAKGNPKNIQELEDLTKQGVRFVNRQRGSGTRVLTDFCCKRAGIDTGEINGYEREELTHLTVAAAVAGGTADVGVAILAAARALGLEFIPLEEERYDLCILKDYYDTPYIQTVLKVINSEEFQREVLGLGGYDLRDCSRIIWES